MTFATGPTGTAGNVADPVDLGSIEYAVEHLGTRLIVVLGHERCGAVTAALAAQSTVDALVLATPLTVCLVVLGRHVPPDASGPTSSMHTSSFRPASGERS